MKQDFAVAGHSEHGAIRRIRKGGQYGGRMVGRGMPGIDRVRDRGSIVTPALADPLCEERDVRGRQWRASLGHQRLLSVQVVEYAACLRLAGRKTRSMLPTLEECGVRGDDELTTG